MSKRFIFRWKDGNIEVLPSAAETKAECWAWAYKWLRSAGEEDEAKVRKDLHENGEVVAIER
jgi:hypothetical protein